MEEITLARLLDAFRMVGVRRLYAKRLAENDNSKNQIYLAGNFEFLTLLPFATPTVSVSEKGNAVMHAAFPLEWLQDDGTTAPAPHSKLILYPQYPEVRLSGFLLGSRGAPSALLKTRQAGRVLFLGIREDRTVVGRVFSHEAAVISELEAVLGMEGESVLKEIPLSNDMADLRRENLLKSLRAIADRGFVEAFRLDSNGAVLPCHARNCGGLTLEGLLGIRPNSRAEPDFVGYEVKQFAVSNFDRFRAKSPITLFTPEPTEGYYVTQGVERFIRTFGYPDQRGRADRLNFGGRFRNGKRENRTRLTLQLSGADRTTGHITDARGGIELVSDTGVVAARWPFTSLISHWNRKHGEVAFVPSLKERDPLRFRFAPTVFLGYGTDFGKFMSALAVGQVFYDPGIKLEDASTGRPMVHKRSQFRCGLNHLTGLYSRFETVLLD